MSEKRFKEKYYKYLYNWRKEMNEKYSDKRRVITSREEIGMSNDFYFPKGVKRKHFEGV